MNNKISNEINIRPAIPADIEAFKQIVGATEMMPEDAVEDIMMSYFENAANNEIFGEICMACERDGKVLGLTYAREEEMAHRVWNLLLIAVAPHAQNQGLGRAMVAHLEDYLRQHKRRMLIIDTSTDPAFEVTQKFYQQLGYTHVSTIPDFWSEGDDKVTYQKKLDISEIRPYQPEDTDALIDIWRKANALAHPFLADDFVEYVAKAMREIFLPNAQTWVIVEHNQPLGFIALLEGETGWEIGGLFLAPDHHGKGLGQKMVNHAVDLHGSLSVEVFEQNTIGRQFYDRYGFTQTSEYLHEQSGQVTLRMVMED